MEDRSEQAQYFIERVRTISTTTSRFGFLFLFSLIYIFFSSIESNFEIAKSVITEKNKTLYFDSVITKINLIKNYNLSKKKDIYSNIGEDNVEDSAAFKKIESKISSLDLLIRYSVNTRSKYVSSSDSLKKLIKVNIDIPTLKPVLLDVRNGVLFWMFLVSCFMLYFLYNRFEVEKYVRSAFSILYTELNTESERYKDFDPQIPFWFAPVRINSGPEERSLRNFIGWKHFAVHHVIVASILVAIVFLQARVAWLSWCINSIDIYTDSLLFYKLTTVILLFISLLLVLIWLEPIRLGNSDRVTEDRENTYVADLSKRDFVKFSFLAVVFLPLIPNLSKYIPVIEGNGFKYKRSRKRAGRGDLSTLDPGFYINSNKGKNTIHYVSPKKICLSLKTLQHANEGKHVHDIKNFEKSLRKIDFIKISKEQGFIDYLTKKDQNRAFVFPFSSFAIENEAIDLVNRKQTDAAFELLIIGLKLNIDTAGLERLAMLFCGLLIRYESMISNDYRAILIDTYKSLIEQEKVIVQKYSKLEDAFEKYTNPQCSFHKKWQNNSKLPWKPSSRIVSKISRRREDEGSSPSENTK